MPGFDRTGPRGRGPRTGRGLGPCGRAQAFRRGFGRGYGRGRAWEYAEPVALTKEEQKKVLQEELKELEAEKQAMEKRLKDLEDK